MSVELIGPAAALALVLVTGPVILVADARGRKMQRQIELVTALSNSDAALPQARSIRRERVRFEQLRKLGRWLFRYDPNFSEAYRLSPPLVAAVGILIGLLAGACASIVLPSWTSVLIGFVAAGLGWRGLFGWQRDRYVTSLRKQLPDALQFAVSAVRAGFPVLEAFRGITREAPEPTRGQFAQVMNEVSLGRSLQEALLNLYHRTQVAEYAIFAVTLGVQTKTGGHLAETIEALAETVRQRITIAARAKALAGEGTVSATILSVLPVITGIALSLIQPGYLEPLFGDPRGQRLFLMAVASLIAGIWMMKSMIAGVVKE